MTDEEKLALDYSYKVEPFMDVGIDNGISVYCRQDVEQAFLAGLEAGRPQWHYPSKGELPEDDRLVVIYYNGGVADFGSYTKGLNGWYNKFGDSISEPYMWISLKPPKEM